MLFQRRTPPTFAERVRLFFWPRRSWSRSLRYFGKRVVRLSGSPHAIAAGFAAGILVSWTPFVGFHIILAAVIAIALGGSVVASLFGTLVGNPLTFPFMWWSSYAIGTRLIDGGAGDLTLPDIGHAPFAHLVPLLKPLLFGAGALGAASALLAYVVLRVSVQAYQVARRHRLEHRRAMRAAGAASA